MGALEQELAELAYCLHTIEKTKFESNELEFHSTNPKKMKSIAPKIQELFRFMTEKPLQIDIREHPSKERSIQQTLLDDIDADGTCLFSGGVDSTVGMLFLRRDQARVLLSHTKTGNNSFSRATKVFDKVGAEFSLAVSNATFERLNGWRKSRDPIVHSRGLLFLINALAISHSRGFSKVILPENGPFILNVETAMFDKSTRTTHPLLLETVANSVKEVTGRTVRVETPFSHWTKAEIMTPHVLDSLLEHTHSCFYTQRQPGNVMCGLCYSCLVRRLSAYAAGVEASDGKYRKNPFTVQAKPGSITKKLELAHRVLRFYSKVLSSRNKLGHKITPMDRGTLYSAKEAEDLLMRFASDLLLGSKRMLQDLQSTTLGPLGRYAEKAIQRVNQDILEERAEQLEKLRSTKFERSDFTKPPF